MIRERPGLRSLCDALKKAVAGVLIVSLALNVCLLSLAGGLLYRRIGG